MLRRRRTRQIIRPLLERLPHLLHVPIPMVDRGHAPVGMPEDSLDELVARIAEAFREARRDGPTQIVRAEFLCELSPVTARIASGRRFWLAQYVCNKVCASQGIFETRPSFFWGRAFFQGMFGRRNDPT